MKGVYEKLISRGLKYLDRKQRTNFTELDQPLMLISVDVPHTCVVDDQSFMVSLVGQSVMPFASLNYTAHIFKMRPGKIYLLPEMGYPAYGFLPNNVYNAQMAERTMYVHLLNALITFKKRNIFYTDETDPYQYKRPA